MYARAVPMVCIMFAGVFAGCARPQGNPAPPPLVVAVPDDPIPPPGPLDDGPAPDNGRRRRPAAPVDGPVIKSFQELLADMPKDKQPKLGPEAIIERNEAKEWLAENAAGRVIEFKLQVRGIDIQATDEGRYNLDVLIASDPKSQETKRISEGIKVDGIKIGDIPCHVVVRGSSPMWTDLDSTTARKYRDLKGKQVVFQGVIDEAEFQESDTKKELIFRILIDDPLPVRSDALAAPPDAPKQRPKEKAG
jgi:hypothetical protein